MRNKIIISIGTLGSGGAERVVSEISSMYCDHFKEVIVFTWIDHPIFYNLDSRVRLVCAQLECKSSSRVRQASWMRHFVKTERPDVFLSFLMPFNMLSIIALAFTGTKIIVCERQDPSVVKTPMMRALRNLLYHFCSRIEVQTSAGKRYFSKTLQRRVYVIPNPNHISIGQRSIARATIKENRIVTVGRLISQKNHTMLIEAFADIHNKYPQYGLDIYGEGELRGMLQQKIDHLGLTQSVLLRGQTNGVVDILATAQIFVLSSNVEGMPNALMEAMALGLPCVSTDVSGVRDIVNDGVNGYVVPKGDVELLAERIVKLIESKEQQQRFSEATISVMEKFDKNKIFDQWVDLVSF